MGAETGKMGSSAGDPPTVSFFSFLFFLPGLLCQISFFDVRLFLVGSCTCGVSPFWLLFRRKMLLMFADAGTLNYNSNRVNYMHGLVKRACGKRDMAKTTATATGDEGTKNHGRVRKGDKY